MADQRQDEVVQLTGAVASKGAAVAEDAGDEIVHIIEDVAAAGQEPQQSSGQE